MTFILGLDLDGVCADYNDGFRKFVAKAKGVKPRELPDPTDWDFTKVGWGISSRAEYEQLHGDAIRAGLMRNLPVMPGAAESLRRLSDAGVHIRIITHRLVIKGLHAQTAGDTVKWLDKHAIPYRDICMIADKPDVGAHLYLDDGPHNIQRMRQAGLAAVTFDAPYNRFLEGDRVTNWTEAEALILSRAGLG